MNPTYRITSWAAVAVPALVLAVTATLASATPVPDQVHVPTGAVSFQSVSPMAQTFTTGITGDLDSIDLYLTRPSFDTDPVLVEIRGVTAGVPDSTVLFSTTVAGATIPISSGTPINVDITGVSATMGDMLAVVVWEQDGGNNFGKSWTGSTGNAYLDGRFYFGNSTGTFWSGSPSNDAGFITYVDVAAATPAPGAVVLIAGGLLVTVAARRRIR